MKNWIEIQFFKLMKRIIYTGYGYCKTRDGQKFMDKSRCGACNASDVQDWIDDHIRLIKP